MKTERTKPRLKVLPYAALWVLLCAGASSASCGGRSTKVSDRDGDESAGGGGEAVPSGGGGSSDGTGGGTSSASGGKPSNVDTGGGGAFGGNSGSGGMGGEANGVDGSAGEEIGSGGADEGSGGTGGTDEGSGASGGGNSENPGVHTLGGACSVPGALGCAGERQKLQLLCDGQKWVQNGTCAGSAVCDTSEQNCGSCQEPPAACAALSADDTYCDGHDVKFCGPDGLGGEQVEACDGLCQDGECVAGDRCPGSSQASYDCSGDCDASGDVCSEPEGRWDCGYLAIADISEFPAVVRMPPSTDACHSHPDDTCDEQVFIVRFGFEGDFHHFKLPEGVEARVIDNVRDSAIGSGSICYVKENTSAWTTRCVAARYADYEQVALLYVPDGSGPLNLEVGEGRCPQ